jgi:hypothetical protein
VGGGGTGDGRRWPRPKLYAGGRREKDLQLLNQCSNEDGPKSKSAWFFKLYNFSLRFICI